MASADPLLYSTQRAADHPPFQKLIRKQYKILFSGGVGDAIYIHRREGATREMF